MKHLNKLPLLLLVTLLSCNKEKKTHEGHNHDHGHTTVMENPEAYTYTFEGYESKNGNEYIKVAAESDNNDTTFTVLVNNWQKLEEIKRTKGVSYQGAELKGLKLELKDGIFIYKDLDKLID